MTTQAKVGKLARTVEGAVERSIGTLLQRLLALDPATPEVAADLAGLLRSLEVAVAARRKALVEWAREQVPEGGALPAGALYGLEDGGGWVKQYDDDGLLTLLGGDPVNGLLVAHTEGLMRLDWKWTDLERYCKAEGLGLLVRTSKEQAAAAERKDTRQPHVLRSWRESVGPKPLPPVTA